MAIQSGKPKKRKGAFPITLSAALTALSLMILYFAAYLPSGKAGAVAIAGLLPAVAVIASGIGTGLFCYVGTGILSLLLLPSKECALLYIVLFGHYPMLKSLIERLSNCFLEWLCKLALFNGLVSLLYFSFRTLFMSTLTSGIFPAVLIYIVGNVLFILYDLCFSGLIFRYQKRILHLRNRK
ncbi:MAG: hypothetical protein PHT34_07295 [Oscillospiraceae bacterium]|nr:hypothetical protein [Oscillospiraceae bacterium]